VNEYSFYKSSDTLNASRATRDGASFKAEKSVSSSFRQRAGKEVDGKWTLA